MRAALLTGDDDSRPPACHSEERDGAISSAASRLPLPLHAHATSIADGKIIAEPIYLMTLDASLQRASIRAAMARDGKC